VGVEGMVISIAFSTKILALESSVSDVGVDLPPIVGGYVRRPCTPAHCCTLQV